MGVNDRFGEVVEQDRGWPSGRLSNLDELCFHVWQRPQPHLTWRGDVLLCAVVQKQRRRDRLWITVRCGQ